MRTSLRAGVAAAMIVLQSALPEVGSTAEPLLPATATRDLVMRACAGCHPIERVIEQRRTAEEWEQLIAVMVDRGASVTDAEQAQIRDYLAEHFGLASDNP